MMIAILLGNFFFSNQLEIGCKDKAKKTPQTNGTKMKEPSLKMIDPKTIITKKRAIR